MERPKFVRLFLRDFIMMVSAIIALAMLILTLITYSNPKEPTFSVIIFAVVGVFSFVNIFYRYSTINSVYINGVKIHAEVIRLSNRSSRSPNLKVKYVYNDENYEKKVFCTSHSIVLKHQVGDTVEVLLNPNNPRKVIIDKYFR